MIREVEFRILCQRHSDEIYRFARSLLANQADAEDATQEVLLRLWNHLPKMYPFNLRAWLLRTTRFYCLDEIRRRTNRAAPMLLDDEILAEQPDELAVNPSNAADSSIRLEQARRLLHDTGFLYLDGTFHVTTSDTESYSLYGLTPDDLAPFSGKPLMDETLYDSYHNMGLIPKWIDSSFDITIGFETFVIVGVKGKDDVGATVTITQEPQGVTRLAGGIVSFSVEAEPAQYLSYQWYFNRKPIAGETSSTLLVFDVSAKKAGVYKVAISGGGTPVMSDGALLQVVQPVTIKRQPASVTAKAGRKMTFSVVALGTGPFGYQWYINSTGAIADATNKTYTIPSVQESDAGQYYVTVTNAYTSALSQLVTLTVSP